MHSDTPRPFFEFDLSLAILLFLLLLLLRRWRRAAGGGETHEDLEVILYGIRLALTKKKKQLSRARTGRAVPAYAAGE